MKRGVQQLHKVAIRLCDISGDSKPAREFIKGPLIELANMYPTIDFIAQVVRNKPPTIKGHYLNGQVKNHDIKGNTVEEIIRRVYEMRTQWGEAPKKLGIGKKTETPSVQGHWSPYLWMKTPRPLEERPLVESRKVKGKYRNMSVY